MPERDIRTKLKLEGESEFRKGMRDAASAVKVLNSEEKLAEAQFKLTGDQEKYLTDKTEILKKKIEEQQKAVKTAEEALAKMKKQGFDPNSKAVQEWTIKLNSSKAQLTQMQGNLAATQRELSQQGDAFAEAGEAAGAYSDQLASISQGVHWQNMVASLQGASKILDTALGKVKTLATAIYNAMSASADWADDIATEAQKAELDVETYQGWLYAAELIDTSVSTIISSQNRLLKQMTSDSTDTAEMFNTLGVATRDETGALRDQNDVFWDVIDALGQDEDAHGDLLTETRRDQIAQELFGKSYNELLPLLNSGRDAWDNLVEEGKNYAAVSEENVAKLTALDDAQVKLDARWNKTKETLAASVAPAFTDATNKISAAVDAFNAFLETPEGQKALDDLNDAISGLLDVITDIDFEAAFDFATKCVTALTNVLNWLIENKELVVSALIAIKGASIGFSVAESVLKFLQLVKGIKWLSVAKGAKELGSALGAGGGGAGAGAGSAGADISGAAGAAGAGAKAGQGLSLGAKLKAAGSATLKEIGMFAASAGTVLGPGLAGIMMGLPIAIGLDKWSTSKTWGRFNEIQAGMPALLGMSGTQAMAQMQETLSDFNEIMTGDSAETVVGAQAMFQKYGQRILELLPDIDFWDAVRDKVDLSDGLNEDEIKRIVESDINAFDWIDLGKDVMEGMAEAIEKEAARNDAISQALLNGVAAGLSADKTGRDSIEYEKAKKGIQDKVAGLYRIFSPKSAVASVFAKGNLPIDAVLRGKQSVTSGSWFRNGGQYLFGHIGELTAAAISGGAAGIAALSEQVAESVKKNTLSLSPALNGAVSLITGTAETLLSQLNAIVASAGQWGGGDISVLAGGHEALSSINLPGRYITAGVDTGSSDLQFVGLGRRTQYPVTGGGISFPGQERVNVQLYIDRHEVARTVAPITAQTIAADLYATR